MTAAGYWAGRAWSPMLLERRPYRDAMAEEVAALEPSRVLELGCAAGTNLAAIRERLPEAELVGYDINADWVARGIEAHGLDLRVGGVEALADESADVAFTLSVLAHIEDPDPALEALLEVAPVLLLLEPWTGEEGLIETDPQGRRATRHSYSWDYPARLRALGARVAVRKMPIGEERLQPLYRLYRVRR